MKRSPATAFPLVALPPVALGQGDTKVSEVELRALEQRVDDAVARADVRILRGVYAEDFRFTHGDGAVQDRAEWLKDVATGQFISRKVTPIEVEVQGDLAVTFARPDVVRREGSCEDRYALNTRGRTRGGGGRWRLLSHRTVQMLTPMQP